LVGNHPTTLDQAHTVDSTFDFLYEQWGKMAIPTVNQKKDDEASKGYFAATDLILDRMSERLNKNKTKWLCGETLTVPDF